MSMYQKDKPVPLKTSASCLYNNLSIISLPDSNVTSYAVVHKTVVALASCSSDAMNINHRQVSCKEMGTPQGNLVIFQAKFCQMSLRNILVLTSQRGVQMFEEDGSIMLFWHAFGSTDVGQCNEIFARGISMVDGQFVAVGTAAGSILIFKVQPQKNGNISLSETLFGHTHGVSDLAHEGDMLASADDSGVILVWQAGIKFSRLSKIHSTGNCCSSVCLLDRMVIAAFGSGHIRVYDTDSSTQLAEICAHSKWINALDVAPRAGLFLSASEDSFVRIWSLKRNEDTVEVEQKYFSSITDVQLCGGQFKNENGNSFGVTGYDLNEVVCFTKRP